MTTTIRISKRKMLIATAALLSVGLGSTAVTGAYFTTMKTVANNQISSATLTLGNIGSDPSAGTEVPVTIANLIPIADSDVNTKARSFSMNIRNTGSVPINWAASLTTPSDANTTYLQQLMFKYSLDNGNTWSNTYTGDPLNKTTITNDASLIDGGAQTIKFLVWLPYNVSNTAQGKTLTFALNAKATQVGAPRS